MNCRRCDASVEKFGKRVRYSVPPISWEEKGGSGGGLWELGGSLGGLEEGFTSSSHGEDLGLQIRGYLGVRLVLAMACQCMMEALLGGNRRRPGGQLMPWRLSRRSRGHLCRQVALEALYLLCPCCVLN